MSRFLYKNSISICSIENMNMSVICQRFISTLKIMVLKDTTSTLRNVHADKLDDIGMDYTSTCCITTTMNSANFDANTFIEYISATNKRKD